MMSTNLEEFPNMDEQVLLVDENNNELGKVTRLKMRRENLWHRSTSVVVINSLKDPHIFIHKRTKLKETFPSYFDISFGGVVAYGEDYLTSAKRELLEESGLDVPVDNLIELGIYKSQDDISRSHYRFYLTIVDCTVNDLKCQKSEVEFIECLSLNEVENRMATQPFMAKCYVLIDLIKEYLSKNVEM